MFIEKLSESGVMDQAKTLYESYYTSCMKNNTTEKQAMAAAVIITADDLVTKWIFKDGNALSVSEMSEFLKSKEAVSAAERGYHFMCDWVSQNASKLRGTSDNADVYGMIGTRDTDPGEGWVFIVRSVWNKVCAEAQISATALLSHLKSKGLIQTRGRSLTKNRRINGIPTECVIMKLRVFSDEDSPIMEDHGDFIEIIP
jgi:hypothetical protein